MIKSILLTATNSHKAGGLFYSVKNLTLSLRTHCIDAKILSYNDEYSNEDIKTYEGIPMPIYHVWRIFGRLGFSSDLYGILKKERPNIVHQQGIWLYNSFVSLKYKKTHTNVKTVIAPRGMLDPWLRKNSPLLKKIVGIWYENENLSSADCLHALCRSEYDSIRNWGLKNPVAIIPNGTNIPNWRRDFKEKEKRTILFLSRIDPKKGIDLLLKAIQIIAITDKQLLDRWSFLIGGWGNESYKQELITFVKENKLDEFVTFRNAAYGTEKDILLKNVDAFILPSHSEGLPMAILEAWAYELPVLMTDYCNLPEGFENNAAFRISTNTEEMANQLMSFFKLENDKIKAFGENGRSLVEQLFSWDEIGRKTRLLYEWLLGKGPKPDFVLEK